MGFLEARAIAAYTLGGGAYEIIFRIPPSAPHSNRTMTVDEMAMEAPTPRRGCPEGMDFSLIAGA
jgi:hypothetical protein